MHISEHGVAVALRGGVLVQGNRQRFLAEQGYSYTIVDSDELTPAA